MKGLVLTLKRIYWFVFFVSLVSIALQLFLGFVFPVASFSFGILSGGSRYLLRYLVEKYKVCLSDDEFISLGVTFMLACMGMFFILAILELLLFNPLSF